jgi:hypothetical protein
MIRILSTLALATALAGPAMAQEARVSLDGKSEQTIRSDIHKAAVKVCSQSNDRAGLYDLAACISDAQADGLAQAKAIQQSQAPVGALARAEPPHR